MKVLIIADPMDSLLPKSDTGLMLAREALKRNHSVFWCVPENIGMINNKTFLNAKKIISCEENSLPQTESNSTHFLSEFTTVWIRKDPPFDSHYVNLCWLLRLHHSNKPLILNPPETLLLCHEKILPMLGVYQGFLSEKDLIPSALSFEGINPEHEFFKRSTPQEVIVKPWLGHGGNSIEKSSNIKEAFLFLKKNKKDSYLLQPFQKEVETAGDRRAYFIHYKYAGSFVRIPKTGDFISNIAQGGSGVLRDLSEIEKNILPKIEKFLEYNKIFLAGIDLLNGFVSEVNITAPTGFQKYKELTKGVDLAVQYLDEVEKLI